MTKNNPDFLSAETVAFMDLDLGRSTWNLQCNVLWHKASISQLISQIDVYFQSVSKILKNLNLVYWKY